MITVVIPLYNKEKMVAETLRSVLAQTYRDYEVVVVDDGSTDGSADVVRQFDDPRIRLVSQKNAGVSAARNRGIEEAKGEHIAFLDADDKWDEGHLENLHDLIVRYPQCRARATAYRFVQGGESRDMILNRMPFSEETGELTNYFEVASCSHPPVNSSVVCIDKDILRRIGGFPVGITSGEDLLTWARTALCTTFAYSRKVTATFDLGDGEKTVSRRSNDRADAVGRELKRLYLANKQVKGLRQYLALWYKMKAMNALQSGQRLDVLRKSLRSLVYRPLNVKVYVFMLMAALPKCVNDLLLKIYSRRR